MSRIGEFIAEIEKLSEMEAILTNYIPEIRDVQVDFKNFTVMMFSATWEEGEAKEAFVERLSDYHEEFSRRIASFEEAYEEVVDRRKHVELLLKLETETVNKL